MKPDAMLVEPEYLVKARQEVLNEGTGSVLTQISGQETILAAYIHESLASMAGKLAIAGAPTQVVQAVHEDALAVVLTSLQALRQGHFELWKDTLSGSRLEQLDPSFKPQGENFADSQPQKPMPPRKKRRKKKQDETEQ